MAIVLNAGKLSQRPSEKRNGVRATVVPAATVWEPSRNESGGAPVRTLRPTNRTVVQAANELNMAEVGQPPRRLKLADSAVLSNTILGGIFGLAIIVGAAVVGTEPSPPTPDFGASFISSESAHVLVPK